MNQVCQGLRSTQPSTAIAPIVLPSDGVDSNMDNAPQKPASICTHHFFMTVHLVMGCISSDNTGCFLVTPNWGNAYIALLYIHDANAILSVPIKNRSKEELLRAITEVYTWLTARGYWPILHKMDNETSHDIKPFIPLEQVKLQYCPPQHALHQPRQTRGPYMEEPLHGGDCRTPTIVPPSPLVLTHNAKQRHAQHNVPVLPQPSPVRTQGIGRDLLI
jgi:hypothetical protein